MDVTANTNMDVGSTGQSPIVESPASKTIPAAAQKIDKHIKPAQISTKDVEEMVEALKDLNKTLQTSLNFSVDEGTNNVVVKVIEKGTDRIIRQIPPEELLKLQEKMQDLTGFLFDGNV